MKINRRRFTQAASALPLAASVSISGAAIASAQDAPKLQMWLEATSGTDKTERLIENVIQPYNDKGGAQIETTIQANIWTATQTALAGGEGPDVVFTPGPTFALELAKANQLVALDDYIAQYKWADTFQPWGLELGKVDGKVYSIPSEVETLLLFYNKTLFETNGWTAPTTMDELVALADTIHEAGIVPFAHSNSEWRPTNEHYIGEFLNHGAEGPQAVYDVLTGKRKLTEDTFVKALEPLNYFQAQGYFGGSLDRYYTTATDEVYANFAYGDAAMNITGTWFLSNTSTYFGESEQEWDWVPMPSATGEVIFDLGIGSTYSINSASKYKDDVAEFFDYYFKPETQAIAKVKCSFDPAPVLITEDMLAGIDPREAEITASLSDAAAAGNYGYTTWTFFPPRTQVFLYEEIEKVWAGSMTVEDYLAKAQELLDQDIADGNVPPIPVRS